MPMGLETAGYAEMSERFELLRQAMREKAVRSGVRAAGNVILKAIEERAPILDAKSANSTALEPGSLKDDLRVRIGRVDKDGFITAEIGPSAKTSHVARWVEWGHRMVKGGYSKLLASGKTRGPGHALKEDVPPHPFIRPGFEASQGEALRTCAVVTGKELKGVLK
jgi:HK97 gp10 family phage protein